jgi:hypothetical protein
VVSKVDEVLEELKQDLAKLRAKAKVLGQKVVAEVSHLESSAKAELEVVLKDIESIKAKIKAVK